MVVYQWKYEKILGPEGCGVWGEKNLFEFMEITLQLVLEAGLMCYSVPTFCFCNCFWSCWQVVPVSIHDLSVTLSGTHLANSEMGPSSIQHGRTQVQLFLSDAKGQPWATCLLGVHVLVLATCDLPCLGYYRLFAKKPT